MLLCIREFSARRITIVPLGLLGNHGLSRASLIEAYRFLPVKLTALQADSVVQNHCTKPNKSESTNTSI